MRTVIVRLCACGCGQTARPGNSYIHGHNRNRLGCRLTAEHIRKIREANTGKVRSEESRQRIRLSKLGERNPMFGVKQSAETIAKKVKSRLGIPLREETKAKIAAKVKRHFSQPEIRARYSQMVSGEKNPNWCGGIAFLPYSPEWTVALRRSIRERDDYTCQVCGKPESFDVHHIDYDKENCGPANLITLCRSCHIRTNHRRGYWTKVLREKITMRENRRVV